MNRTLRWEVLRQMPPWAACLQDGERAIPHFTHTFTRIRERLSTEIYQPALLHRLLPAKMTAKIPGMNKTGLRLLPEEIRIVALDTASRLWTDITNPLTHSLLRIGV